jgi:hypothetical protein
MRPTIRALMIPETGMSTPSEVRSSRTYPI